MDKPQKKKRSLPQIISGWFHSIHVKSALIILCSGALLLALYGLVCSPKQYDLSVGSISRETINATKDVVDEVTTEEKRKAAAAAVEPTYRFQEGVKEEVLSSLAAVFGELRTVQQYAQTLVDENGNPKRSFSDAEIEYAMSLVTSITLNRYQITTLLRTSSESFENMVSTVSTSVENTLNTTIREGQVSQSIQTILQIVGFKLDVSLIQNVIPSVLRACIKPNMVIEQETTEIARQAAMDAVEPIVYLQGQNIIRAGDRITTSQLAMLRSLGLLKDDEYDFSSYQGAALLVALSIVCFLLSIRLTMKEVLYDPRKLMVAMIVMILQLGFSALFHLYFSAYFVPMVFAPVLLSVLLGSRAGLACVAPTAILISGLAAGNNSSYLYEMILLLMMSLAGGICSVRFMKSHPQRIRVLLAGVVSAAVNSIVLLAIRWMTSTEMSNLLSITLWAMGGSVLSSVLALALQPVFEAAFHLATPSKLLELCNPNTPLLRRLQLEAPGTYHHSLIVANLSEAAAERIGANPYLARAAGYYHDIGKLKRPQYFKENQMGENLHDKLDPYVSSAILTSHTKDGYQMALQQRMPQEVANIILQHHGDTPVMFFYHKALQMSNGSPVDMNEFRYEGPRPDSREAAIVMLADTIEAAVRSMQDPTPKAINQFIERLIRGKLEDGQLSNSPITLRDIDEICKAFTGVLMGVFHERIEYPEVRHHVPSVPAQSSVQPKDSAEETPVQNDSGESARKEEVPSDSGMSGSKVQNPPIADQEEKT
ncbi:MAG: HDIG domain-containing protein [Clostridia bacterium]|nr:HDIG domain-containing protein [Clostridia bacterium]